LFILSYPPVTSKRR